MGVIKKTTNTKTMMGKDGYFKRLQVNKSDSIPKSKWKDDEIDKDDINENVFDDEDTDEAWLEDEEYLEEDDEDDYEDVDDEEEGDDDEDRDIEDEEESQECNVEDCSIDENETEDMSLIEDGNIDFVTTNCSCRTSKSRVPTMFSIVNTKKSGRRIAINVSKVLNPLNVQEQVQISYNQDMRAIILGSNLGGTSYSLKKLQNKAVIYNAELIQKLTEVLELDFTSQSTVSFRNIKFVNHRQAGYIAIITK